MSQALESEKAYPEPHHPQEARNSNSQTRPVVHQFSAGIKNQSPNLPNAPNGPRGSQIIFNNQHSEKNFQKLNSAANTLSSTSGAQQMVMNGIDMSKLQQLKAYQPPKLDYLAQMKSNIVVNSNNDAIDIDYKENTPIPSRNQKRNHPSHAQKSISRPPQDKSIFRDEEDLGNAGLPRSSLISADASNLNNPRMQAKQQIFNGQPSAIQSSNAPIRNDQTRESLQSRLIERIHSKKIQQNNNLQKMTQLDGSEMKRMANISSSKDRKDQPSSNQIIGLEKSQMKKVSSKRQLKPQSTNSHLDKDQQSPFENSKTGIADENKQTERRRTSDNSLLENFSAFRNQAEDKDTEKKRSSIPRAEAEKEILDDLRDSHMKEDKISTAEDPENVDMDEQEEGIQADDEDNDQIETERAVNPLEKRQMEMMRILSSDPSQNAKHMGKAGGQMGNSNGFQKQISSLSSSDGPAKLTSAKDGVQIHNYNGQLRSNELYQIKESYEGNSTKNGGHNSGRSTEQTIHGDFSTSKQMQDQKKGDQSQGLLQKEGSSSSSTLTMLNPAGGLQPHPSNPDKLVTASGQVIKRPKSKQQSKKQRQQQQNQQPYSKFSELRKLQSQNTKSNKALDALKQSMNQQMANQHFNYVEEDQEKEDQGSDGGIYPHGKQYGYEKTNTQYDSRDEHEQATLQNMAQVAAARNSVQFQIEGKETHHHRQGKNVTCSPVARSQHLQGSNNHKQNSKQKRTIDKLSHDDIEEDQDEAAEENDDDQLLNSDMKSQVKMEGVMRNTTGVSEEGFFNQGGKQKKQSAIKNYGDIANQLFGQNQQIKQEMIGGSNGATPISGQPPHFFNQQVDSSNAKRQSIMEHLQQSVHPSSGQNSQRAPHFGNKQGQQWSKQDQNIYQMQPSQIYANGEFGSDSKGGLGFGTNNSTNRMARQNNHNIGNGNASQLTQSQDNSICGGNTMSKGNNRQTGGGNQVYMKKFAVTSSNFYRSSHPDQDPNIGHNSKSLGKDTKDHRDVQRGGVQNIVTPTGGVAGSNFNSYSNLSNQGKQTMYNNHFGAGGQQINPSQSYYKQYGGGDHLAMQNHQAGSVGASQVFFGMNPGQPQQQSRIHQLNLSNSSHHNPHNVYANSTVYGYRDPNQGFPINQSAVHNYRDNSFNNGMVRSGHNMGHPSLNGPIFGAGGLRGGVSGSGGGSGRSGGAYNDHQYNIIEQNNHGGNPMGLQFGGNPMRMGNHSLGRNTFYVSDYQIQKQSREFNNQSMGRRQKKHYGPQIGGGHHDVSTAQGSYNMNQDTSSCTFIKPRAISRQADAHIRIEVHKDQRIIHHLQGEKQENMNLMFYNFNDFNNQTNAPNGRRPTAGGGCDGRRPVAGNTGTQTQGGMRTQNNFYKSKNLLENEKAEVNLQNSTDQKLTSLHQQAVPTGNIHETPINIAGDRVPTRERQYRSAHQNVRRRDITTRQYHQQQIAAQVQQQKKPPN